MKLELNEIAQRLDLNYDTLMRWIRQGRIPVKKIGDTGMFNEPELKRWASSQRIEYREVTQGEDEKVEAAAATLSGAMKRGGCLYLSETLSKTDTLKFIVENVPGLSGTAAEELFHQLMEREKLNSTGIGKGVALPHPRNPLADGPEKPMIVTCFLEKPVDFDAIDDKPVSVLFLMLSPDIENHLNLLSKLSFCLRDNEFVAFLNDRPSREIVLQRIETLEKTIDSRGF